MIKDIVLSLSLAAKQDGAIDYALSLASAFGARLTGIASAYEQMPVGLLGDDSWVAGVEQIRAEIDQATKAAIARFEDAARAAGVPIETRRLETTYAGSAEEFGRMARRFDLSVVPQAEPGSGTSDHLIIEATLFDSGRPVIVVPSAVTGSAQRRAARFDQIMIGWDGSRSAARAVADAFPFLQRAKAIEIVTVGDSTPAGQVTGGDLADHLLQHGLRVHTRRIPAADRDVPAKILSRAEETSADLVVMGGYGHSRVREFILGGATRSALKAMSIPTLMSH